MNWDSRMDTRPCSPQTLLQKVCMHCLLMTGTGTCYFTKFCNFGQMMANRSFNKMPSLPPEQGLGDTGKKQLDGSFLSNGRTYARYWPHSTTGLPGSPVCWMWFASTQYQETCFRMLGSTHRYKMKLHLWRSIQNIGFEVISSVSTSHKWLKKQLSLTLKTTTSYGGMQFSKKWRTSNLHSTFGRNARVISCQVINRTSVAWSSMSRWARTFAAGPLCFRRAHNGSFGVGDKLHTCL